MHIERLELVEFRSYPEVRLDLGPGAHVLVGANAAGKTNVLEAIHYLAVGGSHRVASDTPLVRAGAEAAVVRAVARTESEAGRRLTVEIELRPGARNRARVNGQPQPRVRDALGRVRSVLFAPEDLALVRGDPADRRRFLDELLGQRRPAYLAARQDYERVLRQRNALLKEGRRSPGGAGPVLATWTDALVTAGATVLAARIAVVHALAGPVGVAYRSLVSPAAGDAAADVALAYHLSTGRQIPADPRSGVPDPAILAEELRAGVDAVSAAERERGLTLAGPHRDELHLGLRDLPAKGYASHGEQWSLTLALRLASREVLHEVGDEPIVLLDDVFSELDDDRRRRLSDRCAGYEQVIVTAAVDGDVPVEGPRHRVGMGAITQAVDGERVA